MKKHVLPLCLCLTAAKQFTLGFDWSDLVWEDVYGPPAPEPSEGEFDFSGNTFSVDADAVSLDEEESGGYRGWLAYNGPALASHVTLNGVLSSTGDGSADLTVSVGYQGEAPFASEWLPVALGETLDLSS
jgi:hypothetical protein